MNISFLIGAFAASYLQNPTFRQTVDKSVNQLVGSGIDALNNLTKPGGDSYDDAVGTPQERGNSNMGEFNN